MAQSPSHTKLHKHQAHSSTGSTASMTALPPLAPPPLLTNISAGRPPSVESGSSRPNSRGVSPQSTRNRSRPQTPVLVVGGDSTPPSRPTTPSSAKVDKRKSWLFGKSDKHKFGDGPDATTAWIAGLRNHVPYDLSPLLKGEPAPDLWNEGGDTFIHLFPQASRKGASFKVDSSLLSDSSTLVDLRNHPFASSSGSNGNSQSVQSQFSNLSLHGGPQSNRLSTHFSTPNVNTSIKDERHLYLPLEFEDTQSTLSEPRGDDLELVVLYRNFVAFLSGGALIATPRQVSLYSIFMGISSILKRLNFTNVDGSTWGEIPSHSFARYCDELRLADVRSSREKTIEAIVLGEHMRSWPLYNEGFVHAAGRLNDIKSIRSPKFSNISPVTVNRLERASLDVEQRLSQVKAKLGDFDFPSMFSGIANSQTAVESKLVRFKEWKLAFLDFRKFTLAYLRRRYGAWPPKASSKKNNFEESGLNQLSLKELYQDFTDLYDMLADRHSLTPRTLDLPAMAENSTKKNTNEATQYALRRVEGEFDRAYLPVTPPIPFDVPNIPGFASSFKGAHAITSKLMTAGRRLKENEVNELLLGSYNRDHMKGTPFIQDFLSYERKLNQGKTIDEIVDSRCGQWLFMYAVLQSLPMTVVDARDVQFAEGVEYFLCIPPRGGRPWMKEDTSQSRAWYNVANGGGIVSLTADTIDHSVEGIYRRSHCWTIATKWLQDLGLTSPQEPIYGNIPVSTYGLQPPSLTPRTSPMLKGASPQHSPAASPALQPVSPAFVEGEWKSNSNRSSASLGLKRTTPPPDEAARPVSTYNPNITFDAILGTTGKSGKKGKK